jgi:23S rRNA-/tRNA-specific pseudouridylate synthase
MEPKLVVLSQGPHYVAVFKPHNISVVGGRGVPRPTLLDLVRKIFGSNIFPVHRLDRVTSGITVFARSLFAKQTIDDAFRRRLVNKTYYALCEGVPNFHKLTVNQPLKRMEFSGKKRGPMARQNVDDHGDPAITRFFMLKQINDAHCLIEAQPISGRMHQIRAHLAYIGLPIVGDRLYGARTMCAPHTIALCAVALSLPLPKSERVKIDAKDLFDLNSYLSW